jgi:transcriptional regulator with XRE-family HTH domain
MGKHTRRPYATVQAWMDANGFSQLEASKRIGCSSSHLCNILRKHKRVSGRLAVRIAKAANVPLESLLTSE